MSCAPLDSTALRQPSDLRGISAHDADVLAARLLGDRRTKLGGLHIAHARRVAAAIGGGSGERAVAAALLHDVLEKTDTTTDELRTLTRDDALVALVDTLSQAAGEPDAVYLARCAADPIALLIKRADLADKLDGDVTQVRSDVADGIREEARIRLRRLERLAQRSAP